MMLGVHTVTCKHIAKERLGKQVRNKYVTNNRVDPFLGNAHNTRTQKRTGVARGIFYVVRIYTLLPCCGPTRDYITRSQQ
jgi:hypothetical protein